jgi:hypothetical protein
VLTGRKTGDWLLMTGAWLKKKGAMVSCLICIFISRRFSVVSRQDFFSQHSIEKRCNSILDPRSP